MKYYLNIFNNLTKEKILIDCKLKVVLMNLLKMKMKKIYCIKCNKYRKLKNLEISYIYNETLVLSIICSKCSNKKDRISKEEESIEILETLGLNDNINKLKFQKSTSIKYDRRKHKSSI